MKKSKIPKNKTLFFILVIFLFGVLITGTYFFFRIKIFKPTIAIKFYSRDVFGVFNYSPKYYFYDTNFKMGKEISETEYNQIPQEDIILFKKCWDSNPDNNDSECKKITLPKVYENYDFRNYFQDKNKIYLIFDNNSSRDMDNKFIAQHLIYEYNPENKQSKLIVKLFNSQQIEQIKKINKEQNLISK